MLDVYKFVLSVWCLKEQLFHLAWDLIDTPEFTNMTNWKIPILNRKYIFIHGGCFIIM